jgi:hypothetical protein
MSTLLESVGMLWGWPGVLLSVLALLHVIERRFLPTHRWSGPAKLLLATGSLTWVFMAASESGTPATVPELREQLELKKREAHENKTLGHIADSLKQELSAPQSPR